MGRAESPNVAHSPGQRPGETHTAINTFGIFVPTAQKCHAPQARNPLQSITRKKNFIFMPQSLSKVYLHLVFHIKTKSPRLLEEDLEKIHQYIGQLANDANCQAIRVGGTKDHVHILCLLSRDITIAKLVEDIKRNSSRWIKSIRNEYRLFCWQNGYAVFSVSQSVVQKTAEYIDKQKEHHKKFNFKEEYIKFLQLYQINYNDKYDLED